MTHCSDCDSPLLPRARSPLCCRCRGKLATRKHRSKGHTIRAQKTRARKPPDRSYTDPEQRKTSSKTGEECPFLGRRSRPVRSAWDAQWERISRCVYNALYRGQDEPLSDSERWRPDPRTRPWISSDDAFRMAADNRRQRRKHFIPAVLWWAMRMPGMPAERIES